MRCKFINLKVKEKNHKILELIKLSIGGNDNYFYYNREKSEAISKNLRIIVYSLIYFSSVEN